jgi:hypothetical protein
MMIFLYYCLTEAGQLTITMEMSDVAEPQTSRGSAAAGSNKNAPPQQLAATIISISQPNTTTAAATITKTPPALRPSTVPHSSSRTDKHTTADSAFVAATTRPKTTGAITNKKKKDNKGYRSLDEVVDLEQQGDGSTSPPLSPIDEQVLEEVLYSRPTLRLGRQMSMRFRAQTAAIPSRRKRAYKSFSHGIKRPKTTGALTGSGVCAYEIKGGGVHA